MSELSRNEIRKIIIETMQKENNRKSEMMQFAESRGGGIVQAEGRKIAKCSESIRKIAMEQTGLMRETLDKIAEFAGKLGTTLSEMGSLNEGSSMCEGLPTVSELKQLQKEIARLEKK